MYVNKRREIIESPITIRLAGPADGAEVRRLAERDSAAVPSGRLLVAASGGEIRAAMSLAGDAIADPFHPTAEIVALLHERLRQLRGRGQGPRAQLRGLRRRRPRLSPRAAGG